MTAQAVTITEKNNVDGRNSEFHGMQEIIWVWTSDSVTGAIVASTAAGETPTTSYKYSGKCVSLTTVPGTTTSAPTDNYDVSILDEDGIDVLGGAGIDRDTANTEVKSEIYLGSCIYSKLSLRVAGCGTSKSGTVVLFIR